MAIELVSREELLALASDRWPEFLNSRSGLPGPRANLSLVNMAASAANDAAIDALLADGGEYAAMCAAAALAARASSAEYELMARVLAADERWRVREGVAIGLQLLGDQDPESLITVAMVWVGNSDPLVQRAAIAGICEPRLLREAATATMAVSVCQRATESLASIPQSRRKEPAVRVLRQALGYCWSVAIAAAPKLGLHVFNQLDNTDADLAWIVTQNRNKKRMAGL